VLFRFKACFHLVRVVQDLGSDPDATGRRIQLCIDGGDGQLGIDHQSSEELFRFPHSGKRCGQADVCGELHAETEGLTVKEIGRCRVRCVGFMNDNRDPEN